MKRITVPSAIKQLLSEKHEIPRVLVNIAFVPVPSTDPPLTPGCPATIVTSVVVTSIRLIALPKKFVIKRCCFDSSKSMPYGLENDAELPMPAVGTNAPPPPENVVTL
jgi:hypothetical protein